MWTDLSGSLALESPLGDRKSFCVCGSSHHNHVRGASRVCRTIRCEICSHIRRFHLSGFLFCWHSTRKAQMEPLNEAQASALHKINETLSIILMFIKYALLWWPDMFVIFLWTRQADFASKQMWTINKLKYWLNAKLATCLSSKQPPCLWEDKPLPVFSLRITPHASWLPTVF